MEETNIVGRVLRASTTGFDCGTRSRSIDEKHTFGSFVKVPIDESRQVHAIGLIYAIRIDDDPLARELVMANGVDPNVLMDQRDNRMVPVEIGIINVGYSVNGTMFQALPPRPPLSLTDVVLCNAQEVYDFTQHCEYFRLVLNAGEVPADELLAAALRYASLVYEDETDRYNFLVMCGRQLATLLSNDLRRLAHVIALIKPDS
jgi:hypothetical protein